MTKEISLKEIVEVIIKCRRMLVLFFVVALVIAFFFYFTTPRSYTAQATILPVAGKGGGGIAGFLAGTGLGMLTGSETKANVLLIAMRSQTLAENVLKKFDIAGLLLGKPGEQLSLAERQRAAGILRNGVMSFFVTKNGSIVVSATLRDQDKVAELPNVYLNELSLFLNKNAISMNFMVIDKARRPLSPSAPRLRKNLIIALGIAFFFGLIYPAFNMIYPGK